MQFEAIFIMDYLMVYQVWGFQAIIYNTVKARVEIVLVREVVLLVHVVSVPYSDSVRPIRVRAVKDQGPKRYYTPSFPKSKVVASLNVMSIQTRIRHSYRRSG